MGRKLCGGGKIYGVRVGVCKIYRGFGVEVLRGGGGAISL